MDTTHTRHMHHLSRNKIVLVGAFLFLLANIGVSQSARDNYNYRDFQKKPYYFGITLGMNSSGYHIDHSRNFIGNDSIRVAEPDAGPGINLQMIANLKIGEYFDFRLLPGFSFAERNLVYYPTAEGPVNTRKIESVFFDIPFLLRFKSAPYKDKRAFVIGGVKYSYDVASNSKSRQAASLVKISPHDFQLEIGAGMQFFFPYFIFSPEIKYSRGITNTIIYNDELNEARVLEGVVSQIISISFHFEG